VAFMRIVRPRSDAATYDAISREVEVATQHPLGLIMHAAGQIDDEWRIVEVWESEAYAASYDAARLRPAIAAVTGEEPAELPPMETCELHQLVTP
jgi:hypothetical protein